MTHTKYTTLVKLEIHGATKNENNDIILHWNLQHLWYSDKVTKLGLDKKDLYCSIHTSYHPTFFWFHLPLRQTNTSYSLMSLIWGQLLTHLVHSYM